MEGVQRQSVLHDDELSREIAAHLGAVGLSPVDGHRGARPRSSGAPGTSGAGHRPDGPSAAASIAEALEASPRARAIVQRFGRPTLLVRNDTFEAPASRTWQARLYPTKSRLDAAVRSVGRLEVSGSGLTYVGTAWVVADGVAVTNRHVALAFSRRKGTEFVLRSSPLGQPYRPRLDFKEEQLTARPYEAAVRRVLYVAGIDDDSPDVAFLALDPPPGRPLPPPVPLFDGDPEPGQTVAVVGYPGEDPRASAADQARLFGGVYGVKRLAPGEVTGRLGDALFTHDATTLGGSSGSLVLDVATGAALGLHFAGDHLDANYAVSARTLRRFLGDLKRVTAAVSAASAIRPEPEGRVGLDEVQRREGFDERFLGPGHLKVRLPALSRRLAADAVVVDPEARSTRKYLLPYAHFSVATHAGRRTALFTAVNIDGARAQRIKRTRDVWSFDPRISETFQVGNELYAGNDLDRGHLVRRLDPAWGDEAEARTAEKDTFFYTNSSPQHAQFNRDLWLDLEDHILENAATLGFKASVLTGPVLAADDREYRGFLLPQAFWKVAVMVHVEREQLTATGYVVSQADLVTNVEFVFGQFRTYQVPLRRIEVLTGLRFGALRRFDPLRAEEASAAVELSSPADIRL